MGIFSYIINEKFNTFKSTKSVCETIDHNAVHLTKQGIKNGIIIFYTVHLYFYLF